MRKIPYQYGKTGKRLLQNNNSFFNYVKIYLQNIFIDVFPSKVRRMGLPYNKLKNYYV